MEGCKCKPAKSLAERVIDYKEFASLINKMREAQTHKEILEMRLRFKIDQHEKISDEDSAEFATAMCNVVFYEDKVDEYLKEMED